MKSARQRPMFTLAELQEGIRNESIELQISRSRVLTLGTLGIRPGEVRAFIATLSSRLTLSNFAHVWAHENRDYADVYGILAGCGAMPDATDVAWYLKIGWPPPRRDCEKLVLACHPTRKIETRHGLLNTTRADFPESCFCHDN